MPRSFLIKRMEKVSTGYFPWNEKTLVQGCCSEYRLGNSASMINVKKEFNMKENAMNEARDVDVETEEDAFTENEEASPRCRSPTAIKILTPYGSKIPPPLVIISSSCYTTTTTNTTRTNKFRDEYDERCSYSEAGSVSSETLHSSSAHDTIIPSPLGYDNDNSAVEYLYPKQMTSPPLSSSTYHLHNHRLHPYSFGYPYHATPVTAKSLQQQQPQQGSRCLAPGDCHIDGVGVPSVSTIKKHQCEFCLKWFQRSSSLSNHRLIHNNTKSFKCNQCQMSFLRKSDLGKHMVTHSGSKPYQCNVCGKRFSQSSNMLTHQRRHTGIRPYSCGICGKAFYRKVDVRRHASVHRNY